MRSGKSILGSLIPFVDCLLHLIYKSRSPEPQRAGETQKLDYVQSVLPAFDVGYKGVRPVQQSSQISLRQSGFPAALGNETADDYVLL